MIGLGMDLWKSALLGGGDGSGGDPPGTPLFTRLYNTSPTLGANATDARASEAVYVDASGDWQTAVDDEERFTYWHSGALQATPLLQMEDAATNSFIYSEELDNAAWTKGSSSISANATTAPNGTASADKLVENSASNVHVVAQPVSVTNATTYCISCYAKAGERDRLAIRRNTSLGLPVPGDHSFDLATGTIDGATWDDLIIEDVGSGWFRCTAVVTATATATATPALLVLDATSYSSYSGDGSSGIYIWGLTIEEGAVPTSYIATLGVPKSRAIDELSYSGIAADNETRAVVDGADVDVDDWDGVVDATLLGADNSGLIESIIVYTTGERPA